MHSQVHVSKLAHNTAYKGDKSGIKMLYGHFVWQLRLLSLGNWGEMSVSLGIEHMLVNYLVSYTSPVRVFPNCSSSSKALAF